MSNNLATLPSRPKSVTMDMADRYGMDHIAFERTLRGTVFPSNGTPEEFAAFLLVAREHKLNPITKEIYAFPKQGGGIVPIVSIDGWLTLINSHPQFDGMDCEDIPDGAGELAAMRCTIYRKDRSHPVSVTEYLSECYRATAPWKMKHRMLRHKATIQCARYAFGFSGIIDEDEGGVIAAAPRQSAPTPPAPPTAIAPPVEPQPEPAAVQQSSEVDYADVMRRYREAIARASDTDALDDLFNIMINGLEHAPEGFHGEASAYDDARRAELEG